MKKGTIIAAAVFAALLVAAVMSTHRKPERGITRLSFATLDKSRIDRLEIAGPNPVELKKGAAVWTLANGHQADQAAVEAALDALTRIDTADLVTSSSARFAELEVLPPLSLQIIDANGVPLAISEGAELRQLRAVLANQPPGRVFVQITGGSTPNNYSLSIEVSP